MHAQCVGRVCVIGRIVCGVTATLYLLRPKWNCSECIALEFERRMVTELSFQDIKALGVFLACISIQVTNARR